MMNKNVVPEYLNMRHFMNATAPCPCEVEGLINAIGFWEWNFNNFPCTIDATKVADFIGQENFIRNFCHDRKSLRKKLLASQNLKIGV